MCSVYPAASVLQQEEFSEYLVDRRKWKPQKTWSLSTVPASWVVWLLLVSLFQCSCLNQAKWKCVSIVEIFF